MHFDSLDHITRSYNHIYLSPHLDDAALSCGGAIAQHRTNGEHVLVVTLCTAAPAPDAVFSELARTFHLEWGLSPAQVVATRIQEDRAAMDLLGVDSLAVGCLDAIYRHPEAYHSRETLFGTPILDDSLHAELDSVIMRLVQQQPTASFYAPLGVGYHVDHQITYQAALRHIGESLALYEDFPYVARPGERERRLEALGEALQPHIITIDQTLNEKTNAILAYASQLAELAHSQLGQEADAERAAQLIAEAVAEYARQVGAELGTYGERLWYR